MLQAPNGLSLKNGIKTLTKNHALSPPKYDLLLKIMLLFSNICSPLASQLPKTSPQFKGGALCDVI